MKNNIFFIIKIICFIFFINPLFSNELKISSSEVKLNKKNAQINLIGKVRAEDENKNILEAEEAIYNKDKDILNSVGYTKVITSEKFIFESENVSFDNQNNVIESNFPTKITDPEGNIIQVSMFNYNSIKNVLFSRGEIKFTDKNNNIYKFSEMYIDEKEKKIIGSDAKIFFNDDGLKSDPENDPRLFANSISINKGITSVQKGVFTYCKFRENEKCPPWELKAKKISHNTSKKTIYYDNAFLKIYDFPIFYFPKFSHPDPTVDRRSGFLIPTFTNSSNIGAGIDIPYFLNIAKDKDITFTPRIHTDTNPLFLAEYRQDFEKSSFILDTGFTEGYKNKSNTKTPGSRTHIFSKFYKNFFEDENSFSNLEINLQHVSNRTYPKVNKLQTSLVDYLDNTIKNSVDYNYQKEDLFFNTRIAAYEDLSSTGNKKYEFIYPEASLEKNLFLSEELGIVDFKSQIIVRNYDVDKQIDVISNEFNWISNSWVNKFGFENEFLGLIKNINYNAKNTEDFKSDGTVSEMYGALGLRSELGLFKYTKNDNLNVFKPKLLLKISPDDSRKIHKNQTELSYSNLFKLNKINTHDEVDTGSSLSLGFDFKTSKINPINGAKNDKFKFSIGQVISAKENRDMPSKTTLNEKLSDVVGETSLNLNENVKLSSSFLLDQNLEDFNKNKVEIDFNYPKTSFNLSYLEEGKHIGSQEYLQTKVGLDFTKGKLSFDAKRNLLSNSAEFYDLSYEYINDCLRAGLAFRREFYKDRDLEPEDSLIFKVTFTPLGTITTPSY